MEKLKFELIIFYYKRPLIVLNALESILKSDYDNWHLTLIDDSGNNEFEDSFLKFGFDPKKITYLPILMSDDEKIKKGGSIFGKYTNDVISKTDADVIIPICDDDAIFPNYMTNLNKFYQDNPNKNWAYCHLEYFDPNTQKYSESTENFQSPFGRPNLNSHTLPINPSMRVDSSQVTFRKRAFTEGNVWYPYPYTADLDAYLFRNMFLKWGSCPYAGFKGQYKGWFADQLGKRMRLINKTYIS